MKFVFFIFIAYSICFLVIANKKNQRTNIPGILKNISSLSINHLVIYENCIEIEGKTQTLNKLFSTLEDLPLCNTLITRQEKTYVFFST